MEESPICPSCHTEVRTNDYYCFNCGENLKPSPPSISASAQLKLYLKSAILPPFGLYWSIKYLKQPESKSKLVGVIAIVITLAIFIYLIVFTRNLVETVNEEVNRQLDSQLGL